jgi:hypothetical protein
MQSFFFLSKVDWVLLPVSILDANLKVRVGGYIFAPRENVEVIRSTFTSLKEMTGPEWKPQTFISDFKFSPNCLQTVFGAQINFVGCSWHFHYDLPKHIKGFGDILLYFPLPSFVRSHASVTIDHIVRKVIGARSLQDAEAAFAELHTINPKAYEYFRSTWWPEKARLLEVFNREYFTLNHFSNSISESTNAGIKTIGSAAQATSLTELITNLLDKDTCDHSDEKIRLSQHVIHRNSDLFSLEFNTLLESIQKNARGYIVHEIDRSDLLENEVSAYSVIYTTSKNKPHRVSKLAGQQLFMCSCKEDKTSGYPDRHVEALALHLRQPLDYELYVASRWRYPKESQAPVCNMIN